MRFTRVQSHHSRLMPWCAGVLAFVLPLLLTCCAALIKERSETMRHIPSHLTPRYLRCEYRDDPLGIDVTLPRLSWIVESSRRGDKQTAYQILVASTPNKLDAEEGDLWDSGKAPSNETIQVVYAGNRLRSRGQCWWKVRAWDKDGRASHWSEPALWTMGLLGDGDWQAEWIGYDEPLKAASDKRELAGAKQGEKPPADDLVLPPPRYLRREFRLQRPIARATLYATALGIYEIHINGRRASEDYFTPGWTDYNKRVYYNTYDVTPLVRRGENAIGAVLADGWYAGHIGWGHKRDHYGSKTRLRAQLEVEYTDGTKETIATRPSWRASVGPLLEADFLMGESYDARREMPGWDVPGFDDSGWARPNVTSGVSAQVQPYPGVTVQRFAEHKPVSITEPQKGAYVLDLGTNLAGFARLKVKGRAGQKIVLRFAERLNPDGTIYTTNLRSARATDTYICRGGGKEETWEPRFTFHGFQYVEVTGYPGRPGPDAITGIEVTSATPPAGEFRCSNGMANRLYHNIRQTQRANFIDIPTDCPQRDERMGWMGDAQIYIRTAACNSDVAAFFTKWLVDVEDAQNPDGSYPHVAPQKVAEGGGAAAWADAGIICPWAIYQVYGDKRVLERHYGAMQRFIEYCETNSKGLLRPAEGFGEWLSIRADTPKDVLATAYFAHSTALMARIAEVLGKKDDAEKYRGLFERIREAFNKEYVGADGRIRGETQADYVMALAFDLLSPEKREMAAKWLVKDIESRGWHLSTGFVGTKDLMPVLTDAGRVDVAYRLFHNDTFPSWGFSIKQGATSIWERWDGWTPEKGFQDPGMNSFAHYAFGAVGQWMFETIGGIKTEGPAYESIVIRPRIGGKLNWAEVRHDSIRGLIAVDWKKKGGNLSLNVTIPANTTAKVYVPAASEKGIRESGKPAAKAEGVRFLRVEDGAAVYEVASGIYRFESVLPSF